MMQRQRLSISTSGGTAKSDTGILAGELLQIHWHPSTADTGQPGTLALRLLPSREDTGAGFTIHSQAIANFGTSFNESVNASDTGSLSAVAIVGAIDRLRATITPTDTGVVVAGDLYVWTRD